MTLGYSGTPNGSLFFRRGAARALRAFLFVRSRRLAPGALGSVLVISPHPDDETFGCGGSIAFLTRNGASVSVLFLTDGSASHPNHPLLKPPELARRRRIEASLATGLLGVEQGRITFLDVQDGTLAQLGDTEKPRVVGMLAAKIAETSPRAILLPCRNDGSAEHNAAFALVARALAQSNLNPRVLEFPVWSLWNPRLLLRPMLTCRRVWRVSLGDTRAVKARAIDAYPSQTAPIPPDLSPALPAGFAATFLDADEFLFEH